MALGLSVDRPLRVAAQLNDGGCGGTYAEACLVIAGVMSGLSALVWPGTGIDRARFVETWIRFGVPTEPTTARLSLPLLRHTLCDGHEADADALERMRPGMFGFGYSTRVVTGDEVDADEAEIAGTFPHLEKRLLRRHSYPAVFYEHVRSQLVHEYSFEGFATAYPMTSKPDPGVSYSNTTRMLYGDDGEVMLDASTREIHFHVDWLIRLAHAIARAVDQQVPNGGLPRPAAWWLHGG